MKKLLGLTAILLISQPVFANPFWIEAEGNGGNYGGYGPYQTGIGGEFTFLTDLSVAGYANGVTANIPNTQNLAMPNFQSFCVSATVFYGNTLYIPVTPSGYNDLGDPLTAGVAWLYSQFATGALVGYDYTDTAGRNTSAAALQAVFWALTGSQEGETEADVASNPFLLEAEAAVGGGWAGVDNPVAAGTDGVYILDLPGPAQSQLYYAGANGNTIRLPDGGATVALLGTALSALAMYRRRS